MWGDNYPVGTSDCFNIGINGDCNKNCPKLKIGECEKETFLEFKWNNEELLYFRDNGYYEEIINEILKD